MVATKTFAWVEVILGILVVLVPLVWCFAVNSDVNLVNYLVWTEVAFGVIVLIVAVLALITKPPPIK